MSSEVSDILAFERQIADAKLLVERRQIAMRLAENREFRKLILDGFCLHDAARYVQESADPFLNAEQRQDALNMAQASGHLKRFLSITIQMGAHAERTIGDLEEALVQAREEGND
jgi:hypothetical protein